MKPMGELTRLANMDYHGKFTLFKEDDHWRCCLGEMLWRRNPEEYDRQIKYMPKGDTMNEAIENCIESMTDVNDIYAKFE